jgi:hypothetical protein
MAWAEVEPGAAELTIKDTGVVEWNTRLQSVMGDPGWIQLMWDSAERWLGVRPLNVPHGFAVNKDEEEGEFKLDTADALAAAGISITSTISGEPTKFYDSEAEVPVDPLFGYPYAPIYYLTVPE